MKAREFTLCVHETDDWDMVGNPVPIVRNSPSIMIDFSMPLLWTLPARHRQLLHDIFNAAKSHFGKPEWMELCKLMCDTPPGAPVMYLTCEEWTFELPMMEPCFRQLWRTVVYRVQNVPESE